MTRAATSCRKRIIQIAKLEVKEASTAEAVVCVWIPMDG